MILFPAIDLKDGACVRLEQGDMARATVFHRDPAAQARAFEAQGFEYLHVVDLDGAFSGKPVNVAAVESIIDATTIPLQLGGGIRDIDTVEAWLDKGVTRVIIGTAAVAASNGPYYDGYRRCGWVRQFDAYGNYMGRVRTCNY